MPASRLQAIRDKFWGPIAPDTANNKSTPNNKLDVEEAPQKKANMKSSLSRVSLVSDQSSDRQPEQKFADTKSEPSETRQTRPQTHQEEIRGLQTRIQELERLRKSDQVKFKKEEQLKDVERDSICAKVTQGFEEKRVTEREQDFAQFQTQWNVREQKFNEARHEWEAAKIKLKAKLQKQEQVIRETQEAAFRMGDQAGWTSEPDSVIGDELKRLETLVRDFSKIFAIPAVGQVPLHELLHGKMPEEQDILIKLGWEALAMERRNRMAPWLLLSAWLNRFISSEILVVPFYFMEELLLKITGHDHLRADLCLLDLFHVLDCVHGKDSKEVNTARSELLRLLHPRPVEKPSNNMRLLNDLVPEAEAQALRRLVKLFIKHAAPLFANPKSADMHEKLLKIMEKASHVSLMIGTQRSGLQCDGLTSQPLDFRFTSKEAEAHQLHNGELEDDEEALDGKPILLATQPAIIAIGRSDGSDYSVRRVLKKAIVWMG